MRARPFLAALAAAALAGLAHSALTGKDAPPPPPASDAARTVFAACAACHDPSHAPRTGPDLRGVFGRTSGTVPGFRYSRAMKSARLVWNESNLDRFLADPQGTLPGNTMPYPGLPDAAQRAELIAWLKNHR